MEKRCLRMVYVLAMLLGLASGVWSQGVLRGIVVDSQEEPVIGANVIVQGTTTGTITDVDGAFSLQVNVGDALQISYIGFITQVHRVENLSTLVIHLEEDRLSLDEVVVVGYGSMEKKLITSSVKTIEAKDLPTGLGGSTIANALEGKITSLVMSQTASPNSGLTLQLRGMASMNASRSPLVVIDGMPGGDIRSVVQEDIASINILKDASAGAIYGTRATGGVILITTKQAKEGKLKMSVQSEVTFKRSFGRPDVMSASEFTKYKTQMVDYGYDTDWWAEGMSDNPTSNRQIITLQGGSATAKTYATIMYEDNRGVLMGDARKDYSGRVNNEFKVLDGWLDITTHLDYRQATRNQATPSVSQLISNNPTRSPYDNTTTSGYNVWLHELDDYNTIADAAMTTDIGIDKWFRPDVSLKLNILPISGLSYIQTLGYEHRQWRRNYYQPSYSRPQLELGVKGEATLEYSQDDFLNSDGYFSYIHQFGVEKEHSVNAVAGYSYYEANGENFSMTNKDFSVDGVEMWDIGKGQFLSDGKASMSSGKDITEKLFAYLARLNYSYKYKYTATLSFRREGSSKFAENNRWGNFYSASASWRLSNEDFLKDVGWIDDLNFRVGYGVTGNEGFSASYAARMYGSDTYLTLPNGDWAYSYGVTANINPDLGWEEKHEWNIGADYSFMDNRLYGKVDFYRRNVKGLIYNVEVPQPPNTESTMYKNIGTLNNIGIEIEVGGDIVRTKDWTYSSSINLSHNETTIGSLWGNNTHYDGANTGWGGDAHRIEENVKVGSFFLWKYAGIENGNFMVYDKDGNIIDGAVATTEDKYYTGNYMPLLIAGWTHNLRYKKWELSATLTSRIKVDVYNHIEQKLGFASGGTQVNTLLDAYTKHADVTGQVRASDYFLEDATFLKIQNLNLSYTLDTKKYISLVDNVKFYFAANNVYTFTGYSGLNPEVDITGWEGGIEWNAVYPQTRTYTLGMQVNF